MTHLTLNGSDELELFYKKPFYFSYSGINKLLFSPVMFYNHYVLNQREDSTDAHLVAGRVLHCLLLEEENYDKQFITMPGKIPTDSQRKIIDNIFKYHLSLGNNSLLLEDYSQEILTQLLTINLYQSLKTDQQRIDKILTEENKEYFEFSKASQGKTIVDDITLASCRVSVEILRANTDVRSLLQLDKEQDDDSINVYNELHIKEEPSEFKFGFNGFLDNVVVDHNSKTIFINDLKTIGKSIQDFPDSVEYYRYWIQAVIYIRLAKTKFPDLKDYTFKITFIVIDKYNQVYPYQVSENTLKKWEQDFNELIQKVDWHYTYKEYKLPYDLALGNVTL
jgi:hypothetical protein